MEKKTYDSVDISERKGGFEEDFFCTPPTGLHLGQKFQFSSSSTSSSDPEADEAWKTMPNLKKVKHFFNNRAFSIFPYSLILISIFKFARD